VPIAVSARHVHLTQAAVEALFGTGHQLTPFKPLSQPGQYACVETVTLVGTKNEIPNVRILGPVRTKSQVEISRTDEFTLGIDAPVRESGQTDNSPPITLVGPAGTLHLPDGLICAWRHIHMSPDDARHFGVEDRDIVDVAIANGTKGLTFGNVLIRVHPDFRLEMHIDTDEGNAAEISTVNGQPTTGTLVRRYPKPGRAA
jgi:acetate kinase